MRQRRIAGVYSSDEFNLLAMSDESGDALTTARQVVGGEQLQAGKKSSGHRSPGFLECQAAKDVG
jgi:hypothetical protein